MATGWAVEITMATLGRRVVLKDMTLGTMRQWHGRPRGNTALTCLQNEHHRMWWIQIRSLWKRRGLDHTFQSLPSARVFEHALWCCQQILCCLLPFCLTLQFLSFLWQVLLNMNAMREVWNASNWILPRNFIYRSTTPLPCHPWCFRQYDYYLHWSNKS